VSKGPGKSCLTAALASYFEAHAENGWTLRPENKEAFAFSMRMPKRLAAGELPAQTARFRHLRWSLCYKEEPQRTLDVLDYPGEVYRLAFLDPEDDPNPDALKARQTAHADEIRELMTFAKDADQIFVLFNLSDAKNLDTDDQNIDAVWVTVQTLKILGSLKSAPQLTLLVTQADRLVGEGEDVGDSAALLRKYAPIIMKHCKDVKAMPISSLDAENEGFGLLAMVRMLLEKTALYATAKPKWEALKQKADCGEMILREEWTQLIPSAAMFSWISETALSILAQDGEMAECIRIDEMMAKTCAPTISDKKKLAALKALDVTGWPKGARARREKRMKELQDAISSSQFGLLMLIVMLFTLVAFVVAVICAATKR